MVFSPPRGLQLHTAHSPDRHGDTSSSISSIQLHGPEAGSVLQNAESRSLAGAGDEGRQQQVGSFKPDLEAMVTSSRLIDRLFVFKPSAVALLRVASASFCVETCMCGFYRSSVGCFVFSALWNFICVFSWGSADKRTRRGRAD